ncbi:MAG: hypothetical protein PHG65_11490 [Kiritimatiellae bacterium]|nr:hypothetical protein [Kiritimatiellia bacterium]
MKNQEWQIRSRADQCLDCGKKFDDGEAICSRLVFNEEGYVRGDRCTACWTQREKKEGLVSYWRGIYRKPPPPKPEAVQRETAETLLRNLIEEEDAASLNTIYILSVMLERRRILAEKEVRKNEAGELIRIYEHKKTGEAFIIKDPQLKLAELEHVQEEVVARLGGYTAGQSVEQKPPEPAAVETESAPAPSPPAGSAD